MSEFGSWGNYPPIEQRGIYLRSRVDALPDLDPMLPYGNGRSYGDCCLLDGGTVVATRRLDHFISFDSQSGLLRCESGVLLSDILKLVVPHGWFLPVTPGTSLVTVGGAIANDVHGKNHHVKGTFGRHVNGFELLRSDEGRLYCTRESRAELFEATIGGLGLTGLITWAELQLCPIPGNSVAVENVKFRDLDEFFDLSAESDQQYEYTVSWIDCSMAGRSRGRGIFSRANHTAGFHAAPSAGPTFPATLPFSLVNRFSVKPFNWLYYHRQQRRRVQRTMHYAPFLYPLDSIRNWNRVYGSQGFLQYQFVVPLEQGAVALAEILDVIGRSRMGSPLAVLKMCGSVRSPGLLSFPMPGVSLALDFPNHGAKTRDLFLRLDELVGAAGGRLYPAKDAHMGPELFKRFYPGWSTLESLRDPAITSSLWRRVTAT